MRSLLLLIILAFAFSATALSMPLHPDLLARMDARARHALAAEEQSLHERGVDNPAMWPVPPTYKGRVLQGAMKTSAAPDTFKVILLLVDFSDHPSSVAPSFFDSLMYDDTTGTVRDFYRSVSYGSLVIATENPCDSVGWLRMPQTYAYYVNNQYGFGLYPHNAQKLAEDAVQAADPLVDFSRYDNDGDNYVDGLMIVHSGTGRELSGDSTDIHSHAWSMSQTLVLDGVSLSGYAIQPEYWDNGANRWDMTIGVFAHEMGHSIFGLPDLYDYDYDSEGLGKWSLMAGGSWNGFLGSSPANPDIWSRTFMGFINPVNVTEDADSVRLADVHQGPNALRLWKDGAEGNEYFLVENRRKTGYDSTLPGEGLLIYHVDESVPTGNDRQWYPGHTIYGHYLVALDQADGDFDLEMNKPADSGDPWPGVQGKRFFHSFSLPSSDSYTHGPSYIVVSNISDVADTVTMGIHISSVAAPAWAASELDSAAGHVHLAWHPYTPAFPGSAVNYSIYRDGNQIAVTADTTCSDTLTYSGVYRYTFAATEEYFPTPLSADLNVDWQGGMSSITEAGKVLSRQFQLGAAYPNPFNPTSRMTLELPRGTVISVTVFDILGRRVATLYSGYAAAGRMPLQIDGSDWPSGLYLVRAQASNGEQTARRITLVR